MSFSRYPRYKESDVEWLGALPEHWRIAELKHLCEKITDGAHISPEIENGVHHFVSTKDIVHEAIDFQNCLKTSDASFQYMVKTGCQPVAGDVLFSKDGTIGRTAVVTGDVDFVIASSLIIIRPKETALNSRFLNRLCQSASFTSQVESFVKGAGLPRLSIQNLMKVVGCFPPLSEQAQIAAFLDRETAKIDNLVAEQQCLIELLREKRQAVISRAVTKGLNPDAAMKPSGVEWLGDIPAHWGVGQSRRMFAVRSEPALATDRMLTASQKYGVLFQSDFVEREGRRVVEVIMGVESLKHVEPNDFIISMRSFEGGIEWCRLQGSTSFHYVMIKPVKYVHPPYFAHLFKSITYIQALRATTDLIRDGQELRYSNFIQVPLPHVPMEEQAQIAAYLDSKTAEVDALCAEAQRAVDLLQERRSALIQAAVTGQIDTRSLAEQKAA